MLSPQAIHTQLQSDGLNSLPGSSKVWIYQSEALLTTEQRIQLDRRLKAFCAGWQSHGNALKAASVVVADLFIVIAVDEAAAGASGCSIDKSVQLLRESEAELGVVLLNRSQIAFLANGVTQLLPVSELKNAVSVGLLTPETLVFNNLCNNLGQLRTEWLTPAGTTWLARYFKTKAAVA